MKTLNKLSIIALRGCIGVSVVMIARAAQHFYSIPDVEETDPEDTV